MNLLAFIILFIGILSRIFAHAPNFTPVVALALFAGAYLSKKQAVIIPVLLMIVSDIVIGFHNTLIFTWGSVALIAWMGIRLKNNKGTASVLGYSLGSAVLFFIITNFGAWLTLYTPTFEGLVECYVAAIPFFRNTLVSTLVFAAVFFGGYELVAVRVKGTPAAKMLLS